MVFSSLVEIILMEKMINLVWKSAYEKSKTCIKSIKMFIQ